MVYFAYILLFILFYIIIKTKEIKISRDTILFYGKYIAIAIMGIGTNIISAGILGHFMPVEGVTLETLFLVKNFGIIILISGAKMLLKIEKGK
ncbi:hypothetical protein [Aliarcobacter lanthieri]|uniref:hypothetical protein n=1 Tax=Aliarcobacter lanthieri TaxID=1355374 RepID=UPI00047E9DF5|nr:hypothetical protein [Aliarcobacter lanthieri]QKF59213.1 putative membrane protein [Aliarcobacter lanthieri]